MILFRDNNAVADLLPSQKRVKIKQQSLQMCFSVFVRHDDRRLRCWKTVFWFPAAALEQSIRDFIFNLIPFDLQIRIWNLSSDQRIWIFRTFLKTFIRARTCRIIWNFNFILDFWTFGTILFLSRSLFLIFFCDFLKFWSIFGVSRFCCSRLFGYGGSCRRSWSCRRSCCRIDCCGCSFCC